MNDSPLERIDPQDITALILCGGQGLRMGGVDKGLQNFQGLPMVLHVIQRLQHQVGHIILNANRNLSAYEAFCDAVYCDEDASAQGPLAGFMVGLKQAHTPFVLTVACDCPLIPLDLVNRLCVALQAQNAPLAMVQAMQGQTLRSQPVFTLMRVELLTSLQQFMREGGRKIDAWTQTLQCAWARFDLPSDDAMAFANINTLNELHELESFNAKAQTP